MVLEQVLYYISTKVTPKKWNFSQNIYFHDHINFR